MRKNRARVRENGLDSGDNIFGILIHVTLKQAVLVAQGYERNRVSIFDHQRNRIATGWYSNAEDYGDSEVSGCPRVHVGYSNYDMPKGQKWGTALYSGLCVGARVNNLGAPLPRHDGPNASCISSAEPRDVPADRWWDKALKRGFSYREEFESEVTRPFEVRLREGKKYGGDIEQAISEYLENVHDIYGASFALPYIDGTTSKHTRVEVDVLPFLPSSGGSGVSDLTLCTFQNAPRLSFSDMDWLKEDDVSDFNVDVLRVLDLREADEGVVALVRRIAEIKGALDVFEETHATRSNRRRNGMTPEQQAAARRIRLADWAALED
jgi:hypothetical protein